jgi:hypothetical protein
MSVRDPVTYVMAGGEPLTHKYVEKHLTHIGMCGKRAKRPTKAGNAHRASLEAGGRMFDPWGAERHSQRTRQQRKVAPRGRHFGGHAGTAPPRCGPLSAAWRDLASGVSGSRCGDRLGRRSLTCLAPSVDAHWRGLVPVCGGCYSFSYSPNHQGQSDGPTMSGSP